MFALELEFHDGISHPETLLVRRPHAIVGSSEFAHVVIEGVPAELSEFRLVRGVGRAFSCHVIAKPGMGESALSEIAGEYENEQALALGGVTARVSALDHDLRMRADEAPDMAGIRILRRAVTAPSPRFPAVAVLGSYPLVVSFPDSEPVKVGRSRACCIRFDSSDVSAEHAQFGFDADTGNFWVEDLGSTNGTFVDNERITGRCILDSLQRVRVGADYTLCGVASLADIESISEERGRPENIVPDVAPYPCVLADGDLVRPSRLVLPADTLVTVGRDPANEVWVGASHISRRHLELWADSNAVLRARDVSSNGTMLGDSAMVPDEEVIIEEGHALFDLGGGVHIAVCGSEADEQEYAHKVTTSEPVGTEPAEGVEEIVPISEHTSSVPNVSDDFDSLRMALEKTSSAKNQEQSFGMNAFERFAHNSSEAVSAEDDEINTSIFDQDELDDDLIQRRAEAQEFELEPSSQGSIFGKIILVFSILLLLGVIGMFFWWLFNS